MGSCAAPSAKGDDKFITTDYLQQCQMHFDLRQDVRGKFMAKQDTLLSLANVHAVNESGQSSVDIDRVNHQVVNVEAVNFRLPGRER